MSVGPLGYRGSRHEVSYPECLIRVWSNVNVSHNVGRQLYYFIKILRSKYTTAGLSKLSRRGCPQELPIVILMVNVGPTGGLLRWDLLNGRIMLPDGKGKGWNVLDGVVPYKKSIIGPPRGIDQQIFCDAGQEIWK